MNWRLSLRNLRRHPLRTALSILGIAVATALLTDMVMLRGGLETSFADLLLRRGYQVRITPEGTLPLDSEATIPRATGLAATIARDPDVVSVAPVVAAAIFSRRTRPGSTPLGPLVPLFGYGIDPANQGLYQVVAGNDLSASDSTGVLLGEPAAGLLAAGVGDTLHLLGHLDPQTATASEARRLVVRGTVRWLYDYRGQPSVGTVVPVMQSLAGLRRADRASVLMVQAHEGADIAALVGRLRVTLPAVEVRGVDEMVRHFQERMVYFRQIALMLGTVSLVVATLLIGTLLTITVNERLAEIATLRAIGVSAASIVRSVLLEGFVLTLVGGAVGLALGLATARGLDRILTSFPGLPAAFSFFVARPGALAVALGLVLALGLLATLYPAWLAARAPIAATLRAEAT